MQWLPAQLVIRHEKRCYLAPCKFRIPTKYSHMNGILQVREEDTRQHGTWAAGVGHSYDFPLRLAKEPCWT